jgi:hypothetical protein
MQYDTVILFHDNNISNTSRSFTLKTKCYTIQEAIEQKSLYDLIHIKANTRDKIKWVVKNNFTAYIEHEHTKQHIEWFLYYAFRFGNHKVAVRFFNRNSADHHFSAITGLRKANETDKREMLLCFPTIHQKTDWNLTSHSSCDILQVKYGECSTRTYQVSFHNGTYIALRNLIKQATLETLQQALQTNFKRRASLDHVYLARKIGKREWIPYIVKALLPSPSAIVLACIFDDLEQVKQEMIKYKNAAQMDDKQVQCAFRTACTLGHIACAMHIVHCLQASQYELRYVHAYIVESVSIGHVSLTQEIMKQANIDSLDYLQRLLVSLDCRELIHVFWSRFNRGSLFERACEEGNMYVIRRLIHEYKTIETSNTTSKCVNIQDYIGITHIYKGIQKAVSDEMRHIVKQVLYSPLFSFLVQDKEFMNNLIEDFAPRSHLMMKLLWNCLHQ